MQESSGVVFDFVPLSNGETVNLGNVRYSSDACTGSHDRKSIAFVH